MKFSRYRGQDIRSMLLQMLLIVVVALVAIAVIFGLGYKYASPKVNAYIAEARKNKAESEKRLQEEADIQDENEDAADDWEEEENAGDSQDMEEGTESSGDEEEGPEESQDGEGETEDTADEEEDPADPAEDPAIHRYEYIVEDCSWTEAVERCRSRGGYLANINSQEEYEHITSEIAGNGLENIIFYLGASRGGGSDDYYWINAAGEYYGDILNGDGRWLENEPSYRDGEIEENVLTIFYYNDVDRWVWNDSPENILEEFSYYSGRIGYVCEYNE